MGSVVGGKAGTILLALLVPLGAAGVAFELDHDAGSERLEVTAGLEGLALVGVDAALEALRTQDALAAYRALLEARAEARPDAPWDAALRNADAARILLDAAKDGDAAPYADAVARAQALRAGVVLPAPVPLASTTPSAAILSLLAANEVTPDLPTLAGIQALDALPKDVAAALAETVQAFRAYQLADRDGDGNGIGAVLTARTQLVGAGDRLGHALDAHRERGLGADQQAPLTIENVLSIDLGPGSNIYTKDVMLLIDAGGDETYLNNAGGTSVYVKPCSNVLRVQAALFDYDGNDRYISGRSCGVNGGASGGAALLVDRSGNDLYLAGGSGTNGGAHRMSATALLLDLAGNDAYEAGSTGTNGGGTQFGAGGLVDVRGTDRYTAGGLGTNGGSGQTGFGLLFDGEGSDQYTAQGSGTNGGASVNGAGLLVDAAGADTYTAGSLGTNGGGDRLGVGLLYDDDGADVYTASRFGTNGGAARAGLGSLVDGGGQDRYVAADRGVNGGVYAGGPGILLDAGGNDHFAASGDGANGGAMAGEAPDNTFCPVTIYCSSALLNWGLLLDGDGLDVYQETDFTSTGVDVTVFPKGTVGAQVDIIPEV